MERKKFPADDLLVILGTRLRQGEDLLAGLDRVYETFPDGPVRVAVEAQVAAWVVEVQAVVAAVGAAK